MGTVKYSGPIASFHCPTEATIRSLKVHFSPKQLGSGDPSPENVRPIEGWDGVEVNKSGRNLMHLIGYSAVNLTTTTANRKLTNGNGTTISTIDPEKSVIITQTLWPATNKYSYQNGYFIVMDDNLKFEERYDISFRVTNITSNPLNATLSDLMLYNPKGTSVGSTKIIDGDRITFKNAIYNQNTTTPLRHGFDIRVCGMSCTISDFVVIAVDTEDRTYEPYRGETIDYEFGVLGKNKFDKDAVINNSWIRAGNFSEENPLGSIKENASGYTLSPYISVCPNTTYTIKYNVSSLATAAGMVFFSEQNVNSAISGIPLYYQTYINSSTTREYYTFTTPTNCHYIRISTPPNASEVQLELGSTATTYEPYDPNKTVYGGWVDLVSGEVCETHTKYVFTGNENFHIVDSYMQKPFVWSFDSRYATNIAFTSSTNTNLACNKLKAVSGRFHYLNDGCICTATSSAYSYVLINGKEIFGETNEECNQTIADWYSNGTPLIIVAPLRSEYYRTYQLAPIQLQTFLSHNNIWSNADYVEVEYDLHETQTILARKQFIVANQPHIVKPAAAPLQNFVTDMAAPLKECKVYFSPVQDTSNGVPSPDNICPISGWTGVETYRTGKNLLDESFLSDLANYPIIGNYGYKYTDPILLEPNTTYRFSFTTPQTYETTRYWAVKVYDDAYTDINDSGIVRYLVNKKVTSGQSITTGAQGVIRFAVYGGQATLDDIWNNTTVQLELGSTATSYESYSGTTLPIDWTDSAGTIYGGYVDLVTGEVVAEYTKIVLDGVTADRKINRDYSNSSQIIGGIVYLNPIGKYDNTHNSLLSCDTMPILAVNDAVPSTYPYIYTISAGHQYLRLYAGTMADHQELDTSAKRIAFINDYLAEYPATIVYPLATPIHYSLTPTQLKTLRGTNNIYSNTNDNIELAYWTH